MLCVIVSIIITPRAPIDEYLAESCPVLQPIVVHVDGFCAFLLDSIVREAGAGGVVDLDGSRSLGMTKFLKCSCDGYGFACRHIGCCYFGFRCRPHDVAHDFANDMESSVEWRWMWGWKIGIGRYVGEIVESSAPTACFRFG